jgi:ribosomal silencing factor RsfS
MRKAKNIDRMQVNIRLERELFDFIVKYSEENYKTVTGILRELIAKLYKESKVPVTVKNSD